MKFAPVIVFLYVVVHEICNYTLEFSLSLNFLFESQNPCRSVKLYENSCRRPRLVLIFATSYFNPISLAYMV
jgi:hypothetical protein